MFSIQKAALQDLGEISLIMRTEKSKLGFIPVGQDRDGGPRRSIAQGNLFVARTDIGDSIAGYLLSYRDSTLVVRIHQVVVKRQWRRKGVGRRMLAACRSENDPHSPVAYVARVRADLEANAWWLEMGFRCLGQDTHKTSRKVINIYCDDERRDLDFNDPLTARGGF